MGIKEKIFNMEQLDREQIELILHTAKKEKYYQRDIKKVPTLRENQL